MDEQAAILRCQAGKLDALRVLFDLHHRAVFRTAYGIVHNQEQAEDVTQQVFIELFRSIKRFDTDRPFRPWIHRIAVNESLDQIKKQQKARHVPIETAQSLPSGITSPEQSAEESELRAAIRTAIWSLDPRFRAVVVLRYYHGFSESEMAVALNCPQGTVKSRLHYALRKLSEILTAYSPAQSTLNPSAPPPSRHGDQLVECIVRPAQNLKANCNETE